MLMATNTKIEWCDLSLNPGIYGCRPKSEACTSGAGCYAARMAHRQVAMGRYPEGITHKTACGVKWTGKVFVDPTQIADAFATLPVRARRKVFVTSMSDLFVDAVPYTFIDAVFRCMVIHRHHTYLILTKYAQRAHHYMTRGCFGGQGNHTYGWPLDNVWFGVTVENQRRADERRVYLREIPARVKFVSYEPALGPVDWTGWEFVDWMIYGGQSGPKAQPSHPDWFRVTRDWCLEHGIPQFFKSWGRWKAANDPYEALHLAQLSGNRCRQIESSPLLFWEVGKKATGHLLDGEEWRQFPGDPQS